MKTHTAPYTDRPATIQFAGFGDWFEIFRAGEQTDKEGKARQFTHADLDSMIANHSGDDPFPFVIGHPRDNDPAYGWSVDLRRDGDALYVKGRATVPEFEAAVKDELYPNRSVSIAPTKDGGWKIRHLGFLGAKAPAVEGMPRINFESADDALTFEFSGYTQAWAFDTVKRLFRNMREFFISRFSEEDADRVIPGFEIDALGESSAQLRAEASHDEDNKIGRAFSGSQHQTTGIEVDIMSEKEKAEFAAAQEENQRLREENKRLQEQSRAAEFQRSVDECARTIETLQREGRLLPHQVVGLAEFAASLPADVFEFSAPDGDGKKSVSKTPRAYLMEFLGSLGKQIELGRKADEDPDAGDGASDYQAPAGYTVNAERAALDKKARDYMAQKGVDYITALKSIEGGI